MGDLKLNFRHAGGVYAGPWSRNSDIPLSPEVLGKLGACLVEHVVNEAMKDFAMRGWRLTDPEGGPPLHKSFSHQVRGEKTIEVVSSFYGIKELVSSDLPERRMTWLTQEEKDKFPTKFELTPRERALRMRRGGRVSKGERLPLVVPLKAGSEVILRAAPLKTSDAWIHPGIARFTFMQRALKKGKVACAEILKQELIRVLIEGDPTQ